MPAARSVPRRLAYVAAIVVALLGVVELGLRLYTRSLEPDPLPPMSGELALLCFGDSVTEGFGMERKELAAWPAQLHDQLLAEGVGGWRCTTSPAPARAAARWSRTCCRAPP